MNILFVCTGNTCRSPMAEHLLRRKCKTIHAKSAGIFASSGQRANDYAQEAMNEIGIDMDHCSQPVTNRLLDWADLVLTMTIQHKQSLIMQFPQYQEKYYTLKEYIKDDDNEIRNKLRQAYAKYEKERSQFIRQNEHKYDNNHLNELIKEKFKTHIDNIQRLESAVISGDIPDPFGGDLNVYRKTLKELDRYISQLLRKITEK